MKGEDKERPKGEIPWVFFVVCDATTKRYERSSIQALRFKTPPFSASAAVLKEWAVIAA